MALEDTHQLTLRLPGEAAERLRAAAFAARRRPAELARLLVVAGLNDPRLQPPPATPAHIDLSVGARGLLQILAATVSNLSQIKEHATALGGQFTALAQEGGPLASMLMTARALGLSIKAGGPCPPEFAIHKIEAAAPLLNALAKSLNIDRLSVAPPAWHAPLSGMRSALTHALEPEE